MIDIDEKIKELHRAEEIAKDKCVYVASFVHWLKMYEPIYKSERPWEKMTDLEKVKLLENAIGFWEMDNERRPIDCVCEVVMRNQGDILNDEMTDLDFYDELSEYMRDI